MISFSWQILSTVPSQNQWRLQQYSQGFQDFAQQLGETEEHCLRTCMTMNQPDNVPLAVVRQEQQWLSDQTECLESKITGMKDNIDPPPPPPPTWHFWPPHSSPRISAQWQQNIKGYRPEWCISKFWHFHFFTWKCSAECALRCDDANFIVWSLIC